MTQSSNFVVFIVEHVYRMTALLFTGCAVAPALC